MLQKLSIHNYAIIDTLEIDFSERLNIITGETGAGKSIIVGALGLILGERADSGVLVNKEKKCIIEGIFKSGGKPAVLAFFQDNELDADEDLVVRREIGTNGKSRAFVNDTPVNLSQLQQLSAALVDLHQQFDTLELGEKDFQRQVIDALAGNAELMNGYRKLYEEWQSLIRELETLTARKQQFDREADYNRFQFDELDDAAFHENELEQADAELKLLGNAEGIRAALSKVYFELEEQEEPLVQKIRSLANQLHPFSAYLPELPAFLQRLHSVQVELQDLADEADRMGRHVNYEPERIERLNERISLGYRLLKKHGVTSTEELLKIRSSLEEKLQAVLNMDEAIAEKQKQAERLFAEAGTVAEKISASRTRQVKPLEEKINKLLAQVGMPNARFRVAIEKTKQLGPAGIDNIEFLFDANKSGSFQPVRKVASGGELSRLMLCIKSLVAQSIDLPTMIFDEIDTGISGEAARQVGIILKDLAAKRQIICITHQPQIAGRADAHFFVYKEIIQDKVRTNIRLLDTEETITAIARMLSGERPTAAALANAREMIRN